MKRGTQRGCVANFLGWPSNKKQESPVFSHVFVLEPLFWFLAGSPKGKPTPWKELVPNMGEARFGRDALAPCHPQESSIRPQQKFG